MALFKIIAIISLSIVINSNSYAHSDNAPKPLELDALLGAFGWDLNATEIKTEKLTDNLYVLFGAGGNIAASVGEDGVFIVDNQFPQLMPKIEAAIRKVGGERIDFAATTHWHFDHAEGNLALGPKGTTLVAHKNSRAMMLQDNIVNLVSVAYDQKAYPSDALPEITFSEELQFHYNTQAIELMHFGPAHTTGDAAVWFRGANAIHLGDVFNNSGYPFIDADNGGELKGMISFCEQVLSRIDQDTIVIPGHGPVSNYAGLEHYIVMLKTTLARLENLVAEGASLEEVFAANITKEFDEKMGNNQLFINRAYESLQGKHKH
jgi:glyoxylase-like metal-dependent hydrolase (beta-lactamase superfamily II)